MSFQYIILFTRRIIVWYSIFALLWSDCQYFILIYNLGFHCLCNIFCWRSSIHLISRLYTCLFHVNLFITHIIFSNPSHSPNYPKFRSDSGIFYCSTSGERMFISSQLIICIIFEFSSVLWGFPFAECC